MRSPKYFLYLAVGANVSLRVDLTSDLAIDTGYLVTKGYQEFFVLQAPLSIWAGEILLAKLRRIKLANSEQFQKLAPRYLQEILHIKAKVARFAIDKLKLAEFELSEISELLSGRCLLGGEIAELMRLAGVKFGSDLEGYLQYLYLNGVVQREAAVGLDGLGSPICHRCGSITGLTQSACVFCGSNTCVTCTNCQNLGLAKSCTPLYTRPGRVVLTVTQSVVIEPKLDFNLTPPQQAAAEKLIDFWKSTAREFLLWTVCGGGKTEVSFGIIAKELSRGGQVLVAIPRKDVVQELLPRFQAAFPEVSSVALYGGSGGMDRAVCLTIATTHQCLRFYHAFDLIVLDEADAFPYQGSELLHFALQRALKSQGRLVIMTATPDPMMLKAVQKDKLPSARIPARYHRQPLLLPELIKIRLNLTEVPPPLLIQKFLLELKLTQRKALIFLPTIKLLESVAPGLINWAKAQGLKGALACSHTADREALKLALVAGKLDFLVVTTIFERGITIRNVDVLVLEADQAKIFNTRTLVQIAGRVGRHGEPGRVIFLGKQLSGEMKTAVKWIRQMNEEGQRLGYLD